MAGDVTEAVKLVAEAFDSVDTELDQELVAIGLIWHVLAPLDEDVRRRVLYWAADKAEVEL